MKSTELLRTQMNVSETDKQDSGEELLKQERVEGTPFTIVTELDKGSFLVMGPYRLTEGYHEKDELEAEIENKTWSLMTSVMSVIIDETAKLKNELNK